MDDTAPGRLVYALARYAALAGGLVMIAITVITVVSIAGRLMIPLGLSAIPGDFEMVQAGVLFAVFVFLPWCHLERGHAIVAILTDRFPVRFTAIAEFVWDVVMFGAATFITVRMWVGMLDKYGNRESTFILRIPVWVLYSAGLVGAVIFVIVAAYCVVRSGRNALSARPQRAVSGASE